MQFRDRLPTQSEFLRDDCGKHGLFLASKGSAIVAELLRLSEHIPEEFTSPETTEFAALIYDFRYFKNQAEIDASIARSLELTELDEVFAATHGELLDEFFSLFRNVLHYAHEVNQYFSATRSEVYVTQTIDSVLLYAEGKQLFCEIVQLYGVMLLLLDECIGGKAREHLIVSYIRHRGTGQQETADIAALCRATGFEYDKPLPDGYPAAYFARVPIDTAVVTLLIERLRSDDIYGMASCFPVPQHRCSALAHQGGICYILLFFCPDVLQRQVPVMRELVDKHFNDNWVVHYYLGFTADLTVTWRAFPAARDAIARTVDLSNVQYHEAHMREDFQNAQETLAHYLHEGNLTEDVVLDTFHTAILPALRMANVGLRWYMLHGTRGGPGNRHFASLDRQYALVKQHVTEQDTLALILATANVEYAVGDIYGRLLSDKSQRWQDVRGEAVAHMERLSVFYSQDNVLSRTTQVTASSSTGGDVGGGEQQLSQWFADVATRVAQLEDHADTQATKRKAQKIVKALESVLEYHQVDGNLQVVQLIRDTCGYVRTLIRLVGVDLELLVTLAKIGDFSYAWGRLSTFGFYVKGLQNMLRQDPSVAAQMRAVMLKLSSLVALPCCRIDQAAVSDARFDCVRAATADYYSSTLVQFMRGVLQVIPVAIFEILRKVMYQLSDVLMDCPSRMARDEVLHYSQLEARARLSAFTADIARYATGLLAMKNTMMGTIEVHSHALLEDGVRRELVEQVTRELHSGIRFDRHAVPPSTNVVLDTDLRRLQQRLHGIRTSFEYIQDFLNLNGLRVWLEEYSRIVSFTLQMECNVFHTRKVYPWHSPFQNARAPIPFFADAATTAPTGVSKKAAYSFLGSLSQHLLYLTASEHALYVPVHRGWFSRRTGQETVGPRTFSVIQQAIGSDGLSALDQLLLAITAKDVGLAVGHIRRQVAPYHQLFARVHARLSPVSQTPDTATNDYAELKALLQHGFVIIEVILVRLGRVQQMRLMASHELRIGSKVRSATLSSTLDTVNRALLARVASGGVPVKDAPRLAALGPLLQGVGITDPYNAICIDTSAEPGLPELPLFLAILVMSVVPGLRYHVGFDTHVPASANNNIDAHCLMCGIALLLRQYPSAWAELFLHYLCQAMRVSLASYNEVDRHRQANEVLPTFAETLSVLLTSVAECLDIPLESFEHLVPSLLFTAFRM